jgi:hypothetical protein
MHSWKGGEGREGQRGWKAGLEPISWQEGRGSRGEEGEGGGRVEEKLRRRIRRGIEEA